jgi:hypothetical protein
MKIFDEDVSQVLSGNQGKEIMGRVVFRGKGNAYYAVTIDEDTNSLKVYKSGFPDDRLHITISSANIVLIK